MAVKNKEELIRGFNQMKVLEKEAENFYLQVFSDDRVESGEVKTVFKRIAGDENRHTEIVQKIINIISNVL